MDDEIYDSDSSERKDKKKSKDTKDVESENESDHSGEEEKKETDNDSMQDIFGEDSDDNKDIGSEDGGEKEEKGDDAESEGGDNEGEESKAHEPRETIEASVLLNKVEKYAPESGPYVLRLPLYMRSQAREFNSSYDLDSEARSMGDKVISVIRWRYKTDEDGNIMRDENGNAVRESNAKLVRWSDGSFSMVVGDAIYDVDAGDIDKAGKGAERNFIYSKQKNHQPAPTISSSASSSSSSSEEATHYDPTVLECLGVPKAQMTLRPSMLSKQAHERRIKVSMARNSVKHEVATQDILDNPKVVSAELQQRREKDLEKRLREIHSVGMKTGGRGAGDGSSKGRYIDIDDSYYNDNDGDNEGNINLTALKRQTARNNDRAGRRSRRRANDAEVLGSDSEDSRMDDEGDDEEMNDFIVGSDEEEEGEEEDEGDDESGSDADSGREEDDADARRIAERFKSKNKGKSKGKADKKKKDKGKKKADKKKSKKSKKSRDSDSDDDDDDFEDHDNGEEDDEDLESENEAEKEKEEDKKRKLEAEAAPEQKRSKKVIDDDDDDDN